MDIFPERLAYHTLNLDVAMATATAADVCATAFANIENHDC